MTSSVAGGHAVVALTGATGFVGSAILRQLVSAGWIVRALQRPRTGRTLPRLPGVEWIAGDLDDAAALAALMAGATSVVHCAGVVRGARRADFDRTNEEGTRHVVAAAAATPGCTRLLLISSLAARAPELSDYAGSKRRAELALAAAAGGLRWSVLRPPAMFGPGDREMRPLFQAIARGVAVLPARVRGRFSLLYVDDLATAVARWLESGAGAAELFELDDGHPDGYDWDSVIRIAAGQLRGGRPVLRVPLPLPLLRAVAAANRLAARCLGYAPMLTPGKVRELTHPDWVCDAGPFMRATGWHPVYPLARALAATFGQPVAALNGVS